MPYDRFIGYLGILILQSNNIPTLLMDTIAISIITPIQTIIGLSIYLYYSILRNDRVYIIGNIIGICFSIILIIKIIL